MELFWFMIPPMRQKTKKIYFFFKKKTYIQTSFEDIDQYWMNEVESYGEKNVELLLLGNKSDDTTKRVVSLEKAKVNQFSH